MQEKLGIINRGVVYSLYPYPAERPDELAVAEGEALFVVRRGDEEEGPEWWWCARGAGSGGREEQGYLPRNIMGVSVIETLVPVSSF